MSVLELAIVFPLIVFLFMGIFVSGLGVFRYQQIALLAREGARWASVHGPTYQSENSASAPTSLSVYNAAVAPMLAGITLPAADCTLTMTATTASVTITYQWTPEALFSPVTFSNTSTMPITY